MRDLIERQAAIDAITSYNGVVDKSVAKRILIQLPPAQSEPALEHYIESQRIGKWIRNDNGTWSCNKCNSWIPDEQHYYARFCLYCGAKMEERRTDECTN